MQADLWSFDGARHDRYLLAATFEPPSTKDFVFGCWGGSSTLFGFDLCFNFITFLLLADDDHRPGAVLLRAPASPRVVPGKLQIADGARAWTSCARTSRSRCSGRTPTSSCRCSRRFFFFILIGNLFEVVPGFSFSANSRLAFPFVLAMVSWVTYNGVGIKRHGFFGYLRHTCIIDGGARGGSATRC